VNAPTDAETFKELDRAFANLSGNASMVRIMEWVQGERDERDAENRIPGQENRTSESSALTTILELWESHARGIGPLT
jgi:hypothetical protein